jgi:hypothetical protein
MNGGSFSFISFTFVTKNWDMKLSHLSETLIGSEIVKLGGEIREKIRQGNIFTNFFEDRFALGYFFILVNPKYHLIFTR